MLHLIKGTKEAVDLTDYFGIFNNDPQNFRFSIGNRLLLKEMVEFVKTKPLNIGLLWRKEITINRKNLQDLEKTT